MMIAKDWKCPGCGGAEAELLAELSDCHGCNLRMVGCLRCRQPWFLREPVRVRIRCEDVLGLVLFYHRVHRWSIVRVKPELEREVLLALA